MPEVTLDIPKDLYRRAQRLARKRQQEIQELLVESIVLEDDSLDWTTPSDVDGESAWSEERAFQRLHPQLVERYPGQFVAILGGQVVDHDADQITLYRRVKARFPGRFVLLAQVSDRPVEEYIFRSPRIPETP